MIYLIFYANTKVLVSKLMILNQVSIKKRHKLTYFSKFKNI
ncbi:unknown [Alistipes sp. CAG:29]|nr:unknown [Alistipes sp. CAG:29]